MSQYAIDKLITRGTPSSRHHRLKARTVHVEMWNPSGATPLPAFWTDYSTVFPEAFTPLGVLDGWVVCTDAGLPGGEFTGIGCAGHDFGVTDIEILVWWSGIFKMEVGPLLSIVPAEPELGIGSWTTTAAELPSPEFGVMLSGTIGNPPSDFGSQGGNIFPRFDDVTRAVLVRKVGDVMTVFMDGLHLQTYTCPATLINSTIHGFAIDTHNNPVDNIPLIGSPVIFRRVFA
jgi:hypothetical protein